MQLITWENARTLNLQDYNDLWAKLILSKFFEKCPKNLIFIWGEAIFSLHWLWKFRSAPCICYSCSSVSKFASFTRPTPNWKLIALRRSINNHYNPTNNNPNRKSCNLFSSEVLCIFPRNPGRLDSVFRKENWRPCSESFRPELYCSCAVCYTVHWSRADPCVNWLKLLKVMHCNCVVRI